MPTTESNSNDNPNDREEERRRSDSNDNPNDREGERRRSSGSRSQRRGSYGRRSHGVVKIIDQLDDMVFGCNPIRQCDEDDHRNLRGCLSDERYTNGEAAELMRDRLKEAFVHADRSSSELLTDDEYDSILRQGSESTLNTNVSAEGIAIDGGDIKKSGHHTAPNTYNPSQKNKSPTLEKREEDVTTAAAAAAASAVEEKTPSSPAAKKSAPLSSDIPTGGPTRSFFEGETPRTGSRRSSAKNFDTFPSATERNAPRDIPRPPNKIENTSADSSAVAAEATAAATIALLRAESSQIDSSAEAEAKAAATISLLGEPSLIIEAVDYDNIMSSTKDNPALDENKKIDDLNIIVEKVEYGTSTEKCSAENECRDDPEETKKNDVSKHQSKEETIAKEENKVEGNNHDKIEAEAHVPSATDQSRYGGDGKDELDLMVEKVDATVIEDEKMPIRRAVSPEMGATTTALDHKPVVEGVTEGGNAPKDDDYPSCSVQEAVLSFCDDDQGKHGSESNLENMAVSNEGIDEMKDENLSGAKGDADASSTQGTAEEESAAFAAPLAKGLSYEDIEVGYEEHNDKIQKIDDDDTKTKKCLGALCCGWKCACLLVVICIIILLLGALLGTADMRNSKQMAAAGGTVDEYPGPGGDSVGALPLTEDNLPSPTFRPSASTTNLLGVPTASTNPEQTTWSPATEKPVLDLATTAETEVEAIDNRPDDEESGGVINFGATKPSDKEELPTLADKNGLLQDSIVNAPVATPSRTPTTAPTAFPSSASPTKTPSTAPVSDAPTQGPTASPVTDAPSASPVTDAPTQGPTASPVTDAPSAPPVTDAPSSSPVTDAPTQGPTASPVTDAPTQGPTASPVTDAPTQGPTASPVTNAPTFSPVSDAPTQGPTASPVAQDSTMSLPIENIDENDSIVTFTTTADCVPCTNIPTAYMLSTNRTCAGYKFAFERRCGTEFGWWGRDGNPEHCQFSCWNNSVPYASQGNASCCERDDVDDEITGDLSQVIEDGDEDATSTMGSDSTSDEAPVSATMVSSGPTSRPTTASPSTQPSAAPTSSSPTVSPTKVASESPSVRPTTSQPSAAPTSSSPTVSPTKVASESPSAGPTTSQPSAAPTSSSPTASPTKVASESPSVTTAAPTPNPTLNPTHLPTSLAIVWKESTPGHLVTNYNTGKATDGIMLAITAKSSSITITSIDVLLNSMDTDIPVDLMMMEGSYFGYELYSRIWRSVGGYIIPKGNGPSRATTIQGIDPITIPSGKTIGLYIVFPEGHNMLIGGNGEASSDGDIRIYSGSSVPGKFMSVERGVGWSGAIKYSSTAGD